MPMAVQVKCVTVLTIGRLQEGVSEPLPMPYKVISGLFNFHMHFCTYMKMSMQQQNSIFLPNKTERSFLQVKFFLYFF